MVKVKLNVKYLLRYGIVNVLLNTKTLGKKIYWID